MRVRAIILDWDRLERPERLSIIFPLAPDEQVPALERALRAGKFRTYDLEVEAGRSPSFAAEETFRVLNTAHPPDYRNRSMSVGDLVRYPDGRLLLCAPMGFEEVTDRLRDALPPEAA